MYIQFTLYTALCVCALFNASPSAVHLVYMHTHAVVVSIAFAACHHPHTHTQLQTIVETHSLSLSLTLSVRKSTGIGCAFSGNVARDDSTALRCFPHVRSTPHIWYIPVRDSF